MEYRQRLGAQQQACRCSSGKLEHPCRQTRHGSGSEAYGHSEYEYAEHNVDCTPVLHFDLCQVAETAPRVAGSCPEQGQRYHQEQRHLQE